MSPTQDIREVGDRIRELVDAFGRSPDPEAGARAGELVRLLMDLYGTALARIVETLGPASGPVGALADDEVVGALLVLHGLHPLPADVRIARGLERMQSIVAPFGHVRLLAIDGDAARLGFTASGRTPAGAVQALREAVVHAVELAAPEIGAIEIEGLHEPEPEPQPLRFVRSGAGAGPDAVRP